MVTSFVKKHGLHAYHSGLHDLIRLRSGNYNVSASGLSFSRFPSPEGEAVPTLYADGLKKRFQSPLSRPARYSRVSSFSEVF